jgi:hypothetical protein
MWRNFRLWRLSLITLLVMLLVSGLVRKGYAGIEPPGGTAPIANPKLQGEFTAMFDGVDTAAFTFVRNCKRTKVILGSLFLPFSSSTFTSLSDPDILQGLLIAALHIQNCQR